MYHDNWTTLQNAVMSHNIQQIHALFEAGDDINCENEHKDTPLIIATRCGYINIMEILIEAGADVDCNNGNRHTALHIAAIYKRQNAVQLLVKSGADVNKIDMNGETALHIAAGNEDPGIVKILIEAGADRAPQTYHVPQTAADIAHALQHFDAFHLLTSTSKLV